MTKCRKLTKLHKTKIIEQNLLVEALDVTATSQATTIADLLDKIRDLESKVA